jgi:hypothetical protein
MIASFLCGYLSVIYLLYCGYLSVIVQSSKGDIRMVKDIFEKIGGAVVVSVLMDVDYDTAWRWEKDDHIPARRRMAFIAVCKRHGIVVTLQQLSAKK